MKKIELAKAYEPQSVEDGIYRDWEQSGLFNPDNLPGKRDESFTVIMPPPNATGTLHIGHAMFLTLEDIMVRFARMRGKAALWLPGTDHASIATQAKVEKIVAKEEGKTKYDYGREAFIERIKKFVGGSQATIRRQVRKMGASCDWSREAYTLDDPRSRAVREMFVRMFDDGLIYRGYRIVNWCPRCESTLADDEVEYREQRGRLYFMKYGPFTVATTRPETKLGDTGVAVHPEDARYRDMIGTEFEVDFGIGPQRIRVIADGSVDPEFGSGVVGLTPAHSAVDFEMAERNGLPIRKVIGEDGKMTALAGRYAGMTVEECRTRFVADLEAKGLMEKVEDLDNNISVCYRCATPIEPLTSRQWFIDVNRPIADRENKSLKELSVEAVRSGNIRIVPDRFEKVYCRWMENLRPWCISRQIWFGHQVPVWYCDDCRGGLAADGDGLEGVIVSRDTPDSCPKCGGANLRRDTDTLDTWFSSGMWTFSTLGWPDNAKVGPDGTVEKTGDIKRFHPTSIMETGYDILPFWVARMILMTTYALGEVPFRNVYLHGLVRDEQGRKMSKSLENIIDPMDVAEKYGTDAVRLSLTIGNAPGNDLKMSEDKIAYFRNFANKLWNISRFILMGGIPEGNPARPEPRTLADRWILARFDETVRSVTADLEGMNYSRPGETLRDFTWNELADWYLEIAKIEKAQENDDNKQKILAYLLSNLLKLWHPFMPFVTEEIWRQAFAAGPEDRIMVAEWPEVPAAAADDGAVMDGMAALREIIVTIRNIRSEYGVEAAKKIGAVAVAGDRIDLVSRHAQVIRGLARLGELRVSAEGDRPEGQVAAAVVAGVQLFVPLGDLVDADAEKERLNRELADAEKYLAALKGKLGNADFVAKAPEAVVAAEREKLAAQEDKIAKLRGQVAGMS
ncbi:valine--tRNA ligase [Candidatus Uhrbacteria bacterium]|nr:valine--tRNA ligase [Candidatus Uhrbacteria bacterium]